MLFRSANPYKVTRIATICSISFMICWGLILVLAQIKPFWVDEWRIIYNLKFKTPAAIWGPLDFMQQFPRAYLLIIKLFSSFFDYSYFTLRFPSFVVGTLTILLAYHLMNKIYTQKQFSRFLFVLIIVSSHTFTEYFIQVKQYTMDIFLSLVVVWQLLQIIKLINGHPIKHRRYILLTISFLVAPFFSYTYPIVVAPVFFIAFIQSIKLLGAPPLGRHKTTMLLKAWLPLVACALGIIAFYIADVARLMKDNDMQRYWNYLMMQSGFDITLFFKSFYYMLAHVGAGVLFEIVFGVIGILAFIHAAIKCAGTMNKSKWDTSIYLTWYSVLLLVIVIALFIAGKLPIAEARLTSFAVPAIAILIISFIDHLYQVRFHTKFVTYLSALIFIGAIGHIFTSSAQQLLGARHNKTLDIYVNTENAIILAQQRKIPIYITSEIAYPYQKTITFPATNITATALCFPAGYNNAGCATLTDNMPGDWVLKTFPAYKVHDNTPVYALNNLTELAYCMQQLPGSITSVLVGDGRSFHIISR